MKKIASSTKNNTNVMGIISTLKSTFFGPSIDYAELVLDGAVIVDVRSPEEFKMGHSVGAKNIPLNSLSAHSKELKSKTVILVCQSGMRAASAKAMLKAKGVTCHNAGSWTKLA